MDENIKAVSLSHLTPQMVKAARDFVDLKFQIDTEGRRYPGNIPDDLHGPASGGEYGPYFGSDFFNNVIPFLPRRHALPPVEIMSVPVNHTLGCSWRLWPDPDILITEKEEVISYINSEHGIRDTYYIYISELGLFLPGEGKNRVNFCRYHNIKHIPACVRVGYYPDADTIKIYVLDIAGGRDVWAVLDNRFVQKVSHYAYALPLLRAYGVKVLHEWPKVLPAMSDILHNARYCSEDSDFHKTVIDISAVRDVLNKAVEKKVWGEEYVRCRLISFPLRKKYVYLAWVSVVWLVATIVLGSFREGLVGDIALAVVAFTTGSLFVMMTSIFQVRKKHLEDYRR
ncbi:hypothetical protein [Yersinia similis]|uniref:hypothetical protein n=1 Tax=Yersinia similis TaxID=367190 RepID=UPI00061BBB5C|nr:hypothetical protein [Yersinia similis]CNB82203.1 Uncharacterised protein [Yersinia similis]